MVFRKPCGAATVFRTVFRTVFSNPRGVATVFKMVFKKPCVAAMVAALMFQNPRGPPTDVEMVPGRTSGHATIMRRSREKTCHSNGAADAKHTTR